MICFIKYITFIIMFIKILKLYIMDLTEEDYKETKGYVYIPDFQKLQKNRLHNTAKMLKKMFQYLEEMRKNLIKSKTKTNKYLSILKLKRTIALSFDDLSRIQKETIGYDQYITIDSIIFLNLQKEKDNNFVKEINAFCLPNIQGYDIMNIPKDGNYVDKFLLNSIPCRLSRMCLSFNSNFNLQPSSCFYYVREVSTRVLKYLSLCYLSITSKEFSLLINASQNCKHISFYQCYILDESEFKFCNMNHCRIKRISLQTVGYENKKEEIEHLDLNLYSKLIQGIARSNELSGSLESIFLKYAFADKKLVEETMEKYDLHHINVDI